MVSAAVLLSAVRSPMRRRNGRRCATLTVSHGEFLGGVKVLGGVHFWILPASSSRSRHETISARGGHFLYDFDLFSHLYWKTEQMQMSNQKVLVEVQKC